MKNIYLDYSATTPLRPEVSKVMNVAAKEAGNPASVHAHGRMALKKVDDARELVATLLACRPNEIVWTASGTEADNLAVLGVCRNFPKPQHIITTAIEHKAVLTPIKKMEAMGFAVTYINPSKEGIVSARAVEEALRPDTVLVSIMHSNNEVGTIQPIAEIGKVISNYNLENKTKIRFHSDAVQSAGSIVLNCKELGVDLLTISAHKFGGPMGVGVLFVRDGVQLTPLVFGGNNESTLRAGTTNVSGVVGLAHSLLLSRKEEALNVKKWRAWQRLLITELKKLPGVKINGSLEKRLPFNLHFSIKGMRGETIVTKLDMVGISVSAGAACNSGSVGPSYVLTAMGYTEEEAMSGVRVSWGVESTLLDIKRLLATIKMIAK